MIKCSKRGMKWRSLTRMLFYSFTCNLLMKPTTDVRKFCNHLLLQSMDAKTGLLLSPRNELCELRASTATPCTTFEKMISFQKSPLLNQESDRYLQRAAMYH